MSGRLPTDNIIALGADEKWYEIGVAWRNDSGGITLKFNPFVDLNRVREASKVLVAPRTSRGRVAPTFSPSMLPPTSPPDALGGPTVEPDDSDIPF